jgi:ATP-binding cassette subfamily F protein 3
VLGRSPSPRKDQKRLEAEQRQARSRQRKAQQEIVHRLEKEIQELEARQAEIVTELESPETYEKPSRAQAINRELADVQHRLAELNPDWEREATRLAALNDLKPRSRQTSMRDSPGG